MTTLLYILAVFLGVGLVGAIVVGIIRYKKRPVKVVVVHYLLLEDLFAAFNFPSSPCFMKSSMMG